MKVRIPDDKRYFHIGEASGIIGVEPYILRYWETEFSQLKPARSDSRHRTYQKKDLETLLEIKNLLYNKRMTIEGAKKWLKKEKLQQSRIDSPLIDRPLLEEIKSELYEILSLLR